MNWNSNYFCQQPPVWHLGAYFAVVHCFSCIMFGFAKMRRIDFLHQPELDETTTWLDELHRRSPEVTPSAVAI